MSDLFCHATVTRNFIEDACNKPAAGFAMPGPDEVDPWPACAYHLNRWGAAPLWESLAAAWDEGHAVGVLDRPFITAGHMPNPYRPETAAGRPETAPGPTNSPNPTPSATQPPTEPHNAEAMTDHRDAITGQYVTAEHAKANPDTTVSESRVHHTEPIVRTVGDLTARHIGKRVRVETDRTLPDRVRLLREIATASTEAVRLTLEVIDHPEWFLMAHFDLDTPCEVLP